MVMASIASSRPTAVTKSEVLSASVDCCVRDDQGFKLPGSYEPTIVDEVRRDSDDKKTSAAGSNISKAKHEIVLTDQTNLLPFKRVLAVFGALSLCALVSCLDSTIVATALPSISAHFNAGSVSSWVPSAYLLTSTAFQPLCTFHVSMPVS